MARAALSVGMAAKQREAGEIVIEEEILRPIDFAVTIIAGKPLRAIVRVVLRVAGVTVVAEGDVEYRLHMAEFALEQTVGAVQRVTGIECVIKADCVPLGR